MEGWFLDLHKIVCPEHQVPTKGFCLLDDIKWFVRVIYLGIYWIFVVGKTVQLFLKLRPPAKGIDKTHIFYRAKKKVPEKYDTENREEGKDFYKLLYNELAWW